MFRSLIFEPQGVSPHFSVAKNGREPLYLAKNGDRPRPLLALLVGLLLIGSSGCSMIFPDVSYQPVVHNPFPQLSRVAVAPFFNQSEEPTVDGSKFALAYFAELQSVPGYEVVPLGVVEDAIIANHIDLSTPGEARRLGKILGVDAVVIGAITDYTPYYPPRCGMRVEWYSVNQGFHEIPPGYGLPWGTPEEEFIPAPLVFEAEMALARAQMATQTPDCPPPVDPMLRSLPNSTHPLLMPPQPDISSRKDVPRPYDPRAKAPQPPDDTSASKAARASTAQFEEPVKEEELPASAGDTSMPAVPSLQSEPATMADTTGAIGAYGPPIVGWPDERGFIPPPPSPIRPPCNPNNGPVMTHTRVYTGTDSEFTEALASYYHFRDDARIGGWQNDLQRSDDFIRFCCHMHISEMLSARGGAGETRVVWQWENCR